MKIKKGFKYLTFLFLVLLFPSQSFAWSDPTYTDIWSEPTYTDIWSEDNTVYYELEEGSVNVTVTPSEDDSYYVLYRSTNYEDFVELTDFPLTTPSFQDNYALAENTYIYMFVVYDENDNILAYSNYVVVKVLPKSNDTTPINQTSPKTKIELQINNKNALINGNKYPLNVPPIVDSGRTLVPLRFISEAMGAKVDWENKSKKITINLNGKTIILWLNKSESLINNKKVLMDVPAKQIKGNTLVPIRFISENFGQEIKFDKATSKITIITNATITINPLVGTWDLWVPGSYDSNLGEYVPGAGGDTLQIKNDGTYSWKAVDGTIYNGKWQQDGSTIKIPNGRYGWDWNVSEADLSDGKGIRVSSYGVYYEGKRK